ncbi:MAG: hypothetical protein ACEPOV_10470 [Hyphomicrobiales bacterium]
MSDTEIKNNQTIDFNEILPIALAISKEKVKTPNMPVDIAIQEAENQYQVAKEYEQNLTDVGLQTETIELLSKCANALREAQSNWMANYHAQQEAIKNWDNKKPEGFTLQKSLSKTFRYAYRKNEKLLSNVRNIARGSSDSNMIQDISDYAKFGKNNPSYLEDINFDLTKMDDAALLSASFADLYAKAEKQKKLQYKHKEIRDRIFTILKNTLDEIRNCGKFVFDEDTVVRKLFTSNYRRKHNKKKKTSNEDENQNNDKPINEDNGKPETGDKPTETPNDGDNAERNT